MPAVNGVGEPCAGEPHARFDAAGAGNGAPGNGHRSEAARRGNPGKSGCGTCRRTMPPRQPPTLQCLLGVPAGCAAAEILGGQRTDQGDNADAGCDDRRGDLRAHERNLIRFAMLGAAVACLGTSRCKPDACRSLKVVEAVQSRGFVRGESDVIRAGCCTLLLHGQLGRLRVRGHWLASTQVTRCGFVSVSDRE
jgi:hypothetical protein